MSLIARPRRRRPAEYISGPMVPELDRNERGIRRRCAVYLRRILADYTLLDRETLTQEEVESLVREGVLPPTSTPPSDTPAPVDKQDRTEEPTSEARQWGATMPPPLPETS